MTAARGFSGFKDTKRQGCGTAARPSLDVECQGYRASMTGAISQMVAAEPTREPQSMYLGPQAIRCYYVPSRLMYVPCMHVDSTQYLAQSQPQHGKPALYQPKATV